MSRRFRYLVDIRRNRDQQLIVAGSILAAICVALFVNLAIMLTRNSDQNEMSINNETNITTTTTVTFVTQTSMQLPDTTVSQSVKEATDPVTPGPFVTISGPSGFAYYFFPEPVRYYNIGLALNNSLYCTYTLFSTVKGHVIKIGIRLFTEWKGNSSLYVFLLSNVFNSFRISRRYAFQPKQNTTNWQMIDVPFGELPVSVGSLLAVGMQENEDGDFNQIHAVNASLAMRAENINENTVNFTYVMNGNFAPALVYTVLKSS